jgi:hypothetical protein
LKILTVCEGGNVRSVSLAFVLKNHLGHDAVAASWRFNSEKTLEMLYEWAEKIIVMQPEFLQHIPHLHRMKTTVCDVGQDRFGNAFHGELLMIVMTWLVNNPIPKEKSNGTQEAPDNRSAEG